MATASLRRAYVARLRLYHFGFLSRTNKKVAIKSPVPTSAHTSDVCPSGILPRVRRKMPIINGTTIRKIASRFILAASRSCVHPFDPLSAPCGSHEGIRKVLCFPRNLVALELHDAHNVGRLAVICQDEFGDPKIAAANN